MSGPFDRENWMTRFRGEGSTPHGLSEQVTQVFERNAQILEQQEEDSSEDES